MTRTDAAVSDRRADALRKAAQAKRQAAVARAETAIRALVKSKQEINFRPSPAPPESASTSSTGTTISASASVSDLETQLAAARGELIRLRRLLNQHCVTVS